MPATAETIVLEAESPGWVDGLEYLETLEPAFRDNLGPREELVRNFAKYKQRTLYLDPSTSRRLDVIRLAPGYTDLTHCWHNSVEESFVLEGEVRIDGEGDFGPGDYFWRPPGWIHKGASPRG